MHNDSVNDVIGHQSQKNAYFVLFWTNQIKQIGGLTINIFAHEHILHHMWSKILSSKSVLKH